MHLYTLSLVSFVAIGLLLALMFFLDSQFGARYWAAGETTTEIRFTPLANGLGIFAQLVLGLFICIAVANLVCTVLLCGSGPLPERSDAISVVELATVTTGAVRKYRRVRNSNFLRTSSSRLGQFIIKAFVLKHSGGPKKHGVGGSTRPQPGAGELLVHVRSAGLNPVDYKFRPGMLWPIYRPKLPVVMGNELAGTVVELGAGATRFAIGERFFTARA